MAITPDQIKDTGRLIAVVNEVTTKRTGLGLLRKDYTISIGAGQTFSTEVYDLEKLRYIDIFLLNAGSPDTISLTMVFSNNSDMSGYSYITPVSSLANGGRVTASTKAYGRFVKFNISAAATAGTYNARLFVLISP